MMTSVSSGWYPDRPNPRHSERESMLNSAPLILIVEDDPSISDLLRVVLSEEGFRVEMVDNADDAFKMACQSLPTLMLIDVMMPTQNGDLLVQRLQAHASTQQISMALMSSTRPRLAHMVGIPFLPKPFDITDVVDFVRRHMDPETLSLATLSDEG